MSLSLAFIQYDIIWKDIYANFSMLEGLISRNYSDESIVLLPEMFSTGFCMHPKELAEEANGPTINWMKNIAQKYNTIIAGSIIHKEDDKYHNRFLFVNGDGVLDYYNKRHLFTPAGEKDNYSQGDRNVQLNFGDWNIMPQICYDLRFPAWVRNPKVDYDLLIYVASWPETRIQHWKTLLAARAIENQCYCLGVNRVGSDGNGWKYNGHSGLYDFNGDLLIGAEERTGYFSICIESIHVDFRNKLDFLSDRDQFVVS